MCYCTIACHLLFKNISFFVVISSATGQSIKLGLTLNKLAEPNLNYAWPIAKPFWAHANHHLAHAQVGVGWSQAWCFQSQVSVPWLIKTLHP